MMHPNPDAHFSIWLNQFVGKWPLFDAACSFVAMHHLFKGAAMIAALWAVWFAGTRRAREIAVSSALAAVGAVGVARAIAHLAPYRARPLHDARLGLRIARGLEPATLLGWSSFPSDHAAFFMAIATGVF